MYSNGVSPLPLLALAVGGDRQAAGLHASLCGVCAAQRRRPARRLRQLPRVRAAAAHWGPGDGAHDPLRLPRPPVLPRLPQQVSDKVYMQMQVIIQLSRLIGLQDFLSLSQFT